MISSDDDPERGDDPVSHRVVRRSGLRTVVRGTDGWRVNGELLFLQGVTLQQRGPGAPPVDGRLRRAVEAGADLIFPPGTVIGEAAAELLALLIEQLGLDIDTGADVPAEDGNGSASS